MGEPSAGESAGDGRSDVTRALQPPTRLGSRRGRTRTHQAAFLRPAVARRRPLGTSPPLMSIKPISRRRRGTNWRARAKPPPHPSRVKKTRAGGQPARGGRATGRIDESSTH